MHTDIPGFTRHRSRYRAHVTVEREVAAEIASEATGRGIAVGEVLRERVSILVRRAAPAATALLSHALAMAGEDFGAPLTPTPETKT